MNPHRRRFTRHLLSLSLLVGLPAATLGCSHFDAKPFKTGQIMPAPLGCEELLARDQRGDC